MKLAYAKRIECFEGSDRQVDGVPIDTGRTVILDSHNDGVVIPEVKDLHLLPAEGGDSMRITILCLIFDESEFRLSWPQSRTHLWRQ